MARPACRVTLPDGVQNGSHTIYAVGSSGDVASEAVTVSQPTTSFTTSAYDWRDASAGGAEANASWPFAFASDSRMLSTTNWATAFSTSRYLEVDMNSPIRTGANISGGTINIRFATGNATSLQGCFYVEARKASDGSVLGSYGSSASPYCTTQGATQTNFSIPVGGMSGSQANDVRYRIFGRTSSVATSWAVDQISLSLTTDDGNFTLYPKRFVDGADTTPATTPWQLELDDDTTLTNAVLGSWTTGYATTRYMKATFPSYVPAGSAVQSATLTHVYRANAASRQVCNYVEIFAGATSIGTHGSSGSDLSCSSSNSADVTDTIPLPEVDTVAEVNSLSARIYMKRSAAGTVQSRHDQVMLSVTYSR